MTYVTSRNYTTAFYFIYLAPSCAAQIHCSFENPCCIIVDSGHSFTHIVPYIQGKIAKNGVLRIDVGGKALTNQLKDWISYRQLNVTDETYVINCNDIMVNFSSFLNFTLVPCGKFK
uniref:Uncharacterized protein n=1 Tax=Meloidogyne incognita TaxID=6306 RepID=A0A914MQG6_MELIC